jgi:predicted Zn-dependent peptidase
LAPKGTAVPFPCSPWLLLVALAARGDELRLPVHKKVLDNGMTVLVAPDHGTPLVAVRLFYKAGSRNEHEGITGIAHLFEHMMFNGAKKYGPKQFDAVLERAGGAGNAFTTTDFTCYTTRVPKHSLPIVLDLEADRMRGLDLARHILAREVQIVLEERRQMLEDQPLAMLRATAVATLFQAHPYRWPVFGWASDVRKTTVPDCVAFYEACYAPNNAVLVLAGDVEPEAAFALAAQYFGALPRGRPISAVKTEEPPRLGPSRFELRRQAPNATLLVAVQGLPASDADTFGVDLLRAILTSGVNSRLVRRLVVADRCATSVTLAHDWMIDPEPISIEASMPPGEGPERAERALWEELERLQKDGVTPAELARAQIECTAGLYRRLQTLGERATLLGKLEVVTGDHGRLHGIPTLYRSFTPGRLQAIANRLFARERSTTGVLLPETGKEPPR